MSDDIRNIVTDNTVDSFIVGGSTYTRRKENSQAIFSKSGQIPAPNSIQNAIQDNSYQEIFFANQYFTRSEKNSQVIYRRTAVSRDAVISISTLSSPTSGTVDLSIQILQAAASDNWQYNIDGTWSSLFDSSQNSVTISNLSTGQKTIYVRLLHESGGVLSQSDPSTVTVYSFTSSDSGVFIETTKALRYEGVAALGILATDGGEYEQLVPIYAFNHLFLDLNLSSNYNFNYLFHANISFLNYDHTNNQFLPESERKYINAEIDLSIEYLYQFDAILATGNVSFDTTKSWHQVGQNIYPLDYYRTVFDTYTAFSFFPVTVQLSDDGQTCVVLGGLGDCKIFRYINNKWLEIGEGFNNIGEPRISSDGNTIAFANPNESYNSIDSVGVIRVYTYSSSTQTWTQLGSEIFGVQEDEESGDKFSYGSAFHLSGDGLTIAIGSPKYDTGTSFEYNSRGRVRVYRYIDNDWTQIGSDFFGTQQTERLGVAVFLSNNGNTLAIGSGQYTIFANFTSTGFHGRILTYNYNQSNNTWNQFGGQIIGSENSWIGYSMHLSGDGQNISFSDGDTDNRNLKVFRLINNSWTQIGSNVPIVGNNPQAGGLWAQDITQLSDDGTTVYTMMIDSDTGNLDEDDLLGRSGMNLIKIYKYINDDWVQVGNLSTRVDTRPVINANGNMIALVFDMHEDEYSAYFEQVQVFRYVEDQASFSFDGIMENYSAATLDKFSYLTISNSYFDENIFDGRNFEITLLKDNNNVSIRFDAQHRDHDSTKMEFLGISSS